MAAYISFQPSDFFNTKLYDGNSSTQAITGVGFQPDFVWIKNRTDTNNHRLYDAPRGVENSLISDDSSAQSSSTGLTAFDADGFTLGSTGSQNGTGHDYVSWNWKGGTTAVPSGGGITPSAVSFSATSGFGVYTYTGTGTATTIAHGLGVAPTLMIVKKTNTSQSWAVFSTAEGMGYNKAIALNSNGGSFGGTSYWDSTNPTSTLLSVGTDTETNASGASYVLYAFASVRGHSQFGGYKGNGSDNGTFIYTGFRPAYVLIKHADAANNWTVFDNKRDPVGNPTDKALQPNSSGVEYSETDGVDLLSNGFKVRESASWINTSNDNYIYMAFAASPIVSSNSKAGTAY